MACLSAGQWFYYLSLYVAIFSLKYLFHGLLYGHKIHVI